MKKKLFALSLLFSVSACFVSCGDDDDDNDNGGGEQQTTPTNPENEAKIKAVDLGLSVKWCNCNLGSETPEGFGGYYGWGETIEKEEYGYDNYLIESGSPVSCGWKNDFLSGKNITKTANDAAYVKLGDGWRMPTSAEMSELIENCSIEETTVNGVVGIKLTGKTGNSIFLPEAGYKSNTDFYSESYNYWTSNPTKTNDGASQLYGYGSTIKVKEGTRYKGLSIRPVKD